MIEKFLDIPTPDGAMDSFVVYPELGGRYPAVVIYMDIWGLREELFDVTRRIAAAGYHCTLPNTYYREGKVRFEFRNEKGEMRSLETLPQDVREKIRDHMRDLTDAMIVKDARSILEFLSSEPAANAGAKGVIGYCMGGRHALAVAGHYPEQFTATVSLHGTRLVLDTPNSVHRLADKFRGAMYCGFAEHDDLAPPATVKTLTDTLGALPDLKYEYLVHSGTIHGYSLPDRDIYDKQAANRDWERIFSLFHNLQR